MPNLRYVSDQLTDQSTSLVASLWDLLYHHIRMPSGANQHRLTNRVQRRYLADR